VRYLKLFEIYSKVFTRQDEYLKAKESPEYQHLIDMGFVDDTTDKQKSNGTFAFTTTIQKKYLVYDNYLMRGYSDPTLEGGREGIYRIGINNRPLNYEQAFWYLSKVYLSYIKDMYKRLVKELTIGRGKVKWSSKMLPKDLVREIDKLNTYNYTKFKTQQNVVIKSFKDYFNENPRERIGTILNYLQRHSNWFKEEETSKLLLELVAKCIDEEPTIYTNNKKLLDSLYQSFKHIGSILPIWLKRGSDSGLWDLNN
jgi:hypothetical protein